MASVSAIATWLTENNAISAAWVAMNVGCGIDDARESPSMKLMDLLMSKGANVLYSDPYFPKFPKKRDYHFDLSSVDITEQSLAKVDCVLIATAHDIFDYQMIADHSELIVDTRGIYVNSNLPNIVNA